MELVPMMLMEHRRGMALCKMAKGHVSPAADDHRDNMDFWHFGQTNEEDGKKIIFFHEIS